MWTTCLAAAAWILHYNCMQDAAVIERIRRKFLAMAPLLDERSRRQWAATEAMELPYGGVTSVAFATGLSRTTITAGICELRNQSADHMPSSRIRRPGGGRNCLEDVDPGLWLALDAIRVTSEAVKALRENAPVSVLFGETNTVVDGRAPSG